MIARLKRLVRPAATAVVIAVPEAMPAMLDTDDDGMPPHVTVLWPFVRRVRARHRRGLADVARRHEPFAFRLGEIRAFPGNVTYLAPEPASEFVRLTETLVARWPRMKPYEGAYDDVVPHVTVKTGAMPSTTERAAVEALLPLTATARELLVLAPRGECWETVYRVSLGQPAKPS